VCCKPCSECSEQCKKDERADLTLGAEIRTDVFAEGVAFGLVEYRPKLEREEHQERKSVTDSEDHVFTILLSLKIVDQVGFEPTYLRDSQTI
jgi:hypothetical protein